MSVRGSRSGIAPCLLGAHVGWRPGRPAEVRDLRVPPAARARPKSAILARPRRRLDQDVARLDVAVDQPRGMGRLQRPGDLGDPRRRPAGRPDEGASSQLGERLPGDVLHDQVRQAVGRVHDREDDHGVIVAELRGELGLADQAEPVAPARPSRAGGS